MKDCRYYDMCFLCGDECNGEPECPHRRTCHLYSPMPDRGALLTLADECDSVHMHKVARRIREACGVSDDA